ncbi:flagellar FlbD family protein [Eubacteriales bacterium OttesenSCG-928-N14]|nr:flagellar FlbD family protein [Eubacteriales bacterium OttesenSCG-928-N14]
MIKVTRINNEVFMVNADQIEYLEETPDTVISMVSGRKFVVIEPIDVVRELVIDYKRQTYQMPTAITGK